MKKFTMAGLCLAILFAGEVLSPKVAHSQNPIYGKGQGYADQMVLDRMYMRRLKAKYAKRKAAAFKSSKRGSKKSATAKRKITNTSASPTQKMAPFSSPSVHIKRDSFQEFHLDDAKGYTVNFSFTPISGGGKAIQKSFTYNFYDNMADFGSIPAGKYIVEAQATYKGKKYPATIGSESGTPTNPAGGNFASSLSIEIKPAIDSYGYQVLESSPNELQVRVVE